MEALYTKGIVHRDIKPHNLLLAYPSAYNRKPSEIKIKIGETSYIYCYCLSFCAVKFNIEMIFC